MYLGRENASAWKWYSIMDDLSQAESLLRESFDVTSKLNSTFVNSPMLPIQVESDEDDEKENLKRTTVPNTSIPGLSMII